MAHNLRQCQVLVRKSVAAHANALFLPEASDYIGSSPAETVALVRPVTDSPFVLGLQREARQSKLPINVGIHEPSQGGEKVKNTLIWIDEEGTITHRYQKMHLFDVDIQDGPTLKESKWVIYYASVRWKGLRNDPPRTVEKGSSILPPFETPVGRLGLTICFDLRFPEMNLALKRHNSQIITYPSAFTISTGQAHWEVLLRARAIESQTYVIAAAQAGAHNEKRTSYGHSMIVSPWGKVLAELDGDGQEPQIATAEIDLDVVEKVRESMPLLRRTDVYPEV